MHRQSMAWPGVSLPGASLGELAVADPVTAVPPDRAEDDLALETAPSEGGHGPPLSSGLARPLFGHASDIGVPGLRKEAAGVGPGDRDPLRHLRDRVLPVPRMRGQLARLAVGELGLLAPQPPPEPRSTAIPSRVRGRMRPVPNSAEVASTLRTILPMGSAGS